MNRPPPAPPKNLARKAPPPPNKIKKPTPIRPLIAPDEPEQSMAEPTIEPESVSTALPTQDDSQKQQAPIQNIQRKQEEEAKQEEKEEEEKPAEQENRESVENIDGSSLVEIPVEQAPEAGKKAEIPQPARRPPVVPRKAPPQPLGGKKNVVRPPMPKRPIENLPMAVVEEQPAKLSPEKEFEEQKESQVQVQEDKKKTQVQEIVQQEMIPMQQVSEVAEPIAEHKPEPEPEPEPEPQSVPQPVPKPEIKIQKIKAVPALKKPTPKNKVSPSKAIAAPQQQSPKIVSQEDQKKVDQLQSIGKQVRSYEPLLHGSCQLTPKYSNLASKIKSFSARQDELLESSSESEDDEDQPEDKPEDKPEHQPEYKPEDQPEDYKNVDSYSPNRVNSPVRIKDDDDDEVEETPKRQPQQSEIVQETAGFKPNDAIIEIQQNDLEEEPGDKRADQSDEDEEKKLSLSKPLLESMSFAHKNLPTRVEPEIEDDEEAVVADRVEEMDEMNNTLATEQFYKESMEFEPVMSPSLSPIMFKTRVSHSKAEESQREMIRLIESQKAEQKTDLNELLESFPLKKQRWEENAVKLKQMSARHQEEEKQKMEQISQLLDELSRCNMKLKEVMAGI